MLNQQRTGGKEPMIKLFATDLDGTLFRNYSTILEEDKRAMHMLHDHQITLTIATGRSDNEIQEIFKLLNLNGNRISQNGSFVHNADGELLHEQTFSPELSQTLYREMENHGINYLVSTKDHIMTKDKNDFFKKYEDVFFFPLVESQAFDTEIGKTIIPSKFMIVGETDEVSAVQAELAKQYEGSMESYLSDPSCVDLVPKGISKGTALDRLLKTIDIAPEEIAVIGDSFNDISMFQMTPHSYAMASAHPDVKKHANYVVEHVHEAVADLKTKGLLG